MTEANRHGLVMRSGGAQTMSAADDFPMLAKDAPPLPPGRPFVDDLDRTDILMGVAPRPRPCIAVPPLARPTPPAAPTPVSPAVAWHAGYGGALAPMRFEIRGGGFAAEAPFLAGGCRFRDVLDAVLAAWPAVTRLELLGKRQQWSVAWPRMALYALMKEFTTLSLPRIGAAVGGRDHTTVLQGVRRTETLRRHDEDFAERYEAARKILRACVAAREQALRRLEGETR